VSSQTSDIVSNGLIRPGTAATRGHSSKREGRIVSGLNKAGAPLSERARPARADALDLVPLPRQPRDGGPRVVFVLHDVAAGERTPGTARLGRGARAIGPASVPARSRARVLAGLWPFRWLGCY
jgi:hypothetical protein